MKKRHVRGVVGLLSLLVAGFLSLTPVFSNPARSEDLEATINVARTEAATKYAADWLYGRLKDSDYNMPAITYKGPPITLRWSHHVPANSGYARTVLGPGLKLLEKLSKGKIKVEERWGGTVHAANAGFEATRSGLTDLTACYIFYDPTAFHLMHALDLPGIVPSAAAGSRITAEVYDKFFRKEFERQGVLMGVVYTTTPYVVLSKKVLDSQASLKGQKIRTGGGVEVSVWKALGAVPTTMPAPRIYTAFQRGLLDAVTFPDSTSVLFHIDELAKSHTYINLTRINQEHCLSRKWYEALPPDLKVVVSRWAQGFSQAISQVFYVLDGARARVKFRKEGIHIVHLTDAQKARWQAKVAPVTAAWIKQNEAQGRPAKQLVDFIRQRAAHYAKMTPEEIMRETIQHPVSNFVSRAAGK